MDSNEEAETVDLVDRTPEHLARLWKKIREDQNMYLAADTETTEENFNKGMFKFTDSPGKSICQARDGSKCSCPRSDFWNGVAWLGLCILGGMISAAVFSWLS